MIILNIETSTNICSVALSEELKCIFKVSNNEGMNHAAMLSLFIQDALIYLKNENKNLDAVAVSSGPGSYTGLRIGVSTAKGICYGQNIPLISVSTLQTMAYAAKQNISDTNALLCSMIDARRMEVYTAFYNSNLDVIRQVTADIIEPESYIEILDTQKVYFYGNGADKCKTEIKNPNAIFIENIIPLAENMIPFAFDLFNKKQFEDVAYFEPFYLKEFQATTPKKILNT